MKNSHYRLNSLAIALLGVFLGGCSTSKPTIALDPPLERARDIDIRRVNNRSPVFYVADGDLEFFMNYTGFKYTAGSKTEGKRFFREAIADKALRMIDAAENTIIMSVFLYDNFYAAGGEQADIVGKLQAAFIEKRKTYPDIRIAVILDPSHKSYGSRVSPAEKELRANGIDVFYSDLLAGLKKASLLGTRDGLGHIGRGIDRLTFNKAGDLMSSVFSRAKIPAKFDGDLISLESAYNAFLLKANHRKLLVCDIGGTDHEALVTSANPHNASAYHVNTAVTVKGDAARYIYNVLRLDIEQSVSLGRRYSHWADNTDRSRRKNYVRKELPAIPLQSRVLVPDSSRRIEVTFVSEREIRKAVIGMLDDVGAGDEVRIQMFYLSFPPVLEAILSAAELTEKPIRLILDANKDSFNREKDGTPNRQAAAYLLKKSKNIEVRWYSTHGEQNHAKIMTICNDETGKFELTTGSCNWTGRNMDGVNMEANIVTRNSSRICGEFNALFDLFWSNGDGSEYSLDYDRYSDPATSMKWKLGEKPFYWSTF